MQQPVHTPEGPVKPILSTQRFSLHSTQPQTIHNIVRSLVRPDMSKHRVLCGLFAFLKCIFRINQNTKFNAISANS